MYTSHGHQIPGTSVEDESPMITECGGLGACSECNAEFANWAMGALETPAKPPIRVRLTDCDFDAMQWVGTAETATPIIDWILKTGGTASYDDRKGLEDSRPVIQINTPGGYSLARAGCYIIKVSETSYRVVSQYEFEQLYKII